MHRWRILLLGCLLPALSLRAADTPATASAIAGGDVRLRLAWCQDPGNDVADAAVHGHPARLMALDTADGRGERALLPEAETYAKPLLTPDGAQVVFTHWRERTVYRVGFDGAGLRALAEGAALAVWRDARTETDWVYAGHVAGGVEPLINVPIVAVRRFRLDKPEISEPVWTQTPVHMDNFQVSADGRSAGGQFPWPSAGVAALPDGGWAKFGDGCWPSLAPPPERLLWIFDGAHRNLSLFHTTTREHWVANINQAPGIGGFEVYHPRWSNHARFLAMTGPYKAGEGDNRIRFGGRDVELYVGRFAADFKAVEHWTRITSNACADFFPDLWVDRATAPPDAPAAADPAAGTAGIFPAAGPPWPVAADGLVYLWQNRARENTFTDPAARQTHACRAEPRGRARFGRQFEMAPAGGAFIAEGGAGPLAARCIASGQLALELLLTPDPRAARRFLPIAGYAHPAGGWNFVLGQDGRQLVFLLRAGPGKPDTRIPLGPLPDNRPRHVTVSCLASNAAWFLDGAPAGSRDGLAAGDWQDGPLVFGNAWRRDYPVEDAGEDGWRGTLEHVAISARWIGPGEARKAFLASTAGRATRPAPPPAASVEARLLAWPRIPDPASIAPYRRALAVGQYRVERVTAGACAHPDLLVARWVILDARPLRAAAARTGDVQRLRIEPFADRPELEGERLVQDSDRYDLPLYFDASDD